MRFSPEKHLAEWKAQHRRYEVYAYGKFKPALDAQIKPVIAHVKLYGGISAELSDMLIRKTPVEAAYKAVYIPIGVLGAKATYSQIQQYAKKSLPSFFSEKWHKLMELFFTNESADRVSDVTETTRERVRKVLADSMDLPISERATYIEDTLDDPAFNRSRALMIARTESTLAANKGAALGNDEADYETDKIWLAVLDANTRPDHEIASGQRVDSSDFFVVGGYSCLFPGDVSLPASEVVNCRCTSAYVPKFSGDGLPVLK